MSPLMLDLALSLHLTGAAFVLSSADDSLCHSMEEQSREERRPRVLARMYADAGECGQELRDLLRIRAGRTRVVVRRDRAVRVTQPRSPPPPPPPPRRAESAPNRPGSGARPLRAERPERPRAAAPQAEPLPIDRQAPLRLTYNNVSMRRETPSVSSCDAPAAGWIGLLETITAGGEVTFDGTAPTRRSVPPNTVPDLMGTLTFSPEQPAFLFAQPAPCYGGEARLCQTIFRSGTFVVTGRVRYDAGPRGGIRWLLCLTDEREFQR